jgi:glycosyltransferase involved in cell wall biosynthesis
MSHRISIVTPTRNMAHFLEDCILSILQQNYPHVEHIVVDGSSTDNTREILDGYPHLRWISEPDRGLSDALNKGIRMATGEIIGWCNADDLYLPGTLRIVDEILRQDPSIDVLYGDYRETDQLGRALRIRRETHFSPTMFRWLHVNLVPTPSAFWRKRIHGNDLWFDADFRYAMDYDFLRRALDRGVKFKHVSILFADFRRHDGSLTAAGGQAREHEFVVRRDANSFWKLSGPAFPIVRNCFLLGARAARTAEKSFRGYYIEQNRR